MPPAFLLSGLCVLCARDGCVVLRSVSQRLYGVGADFRPVISIELLLVTVDDLMAGYGLNIVVDFILVSKELM